MNVRNYIPDHAITTIPALALLLWLHFTLFGDETLEPSIQLAPVSYYQEPAISPLVEHRLDVDLSLSKLNINDDSLLANLHELLESGEYSQARIKLLELAASEVNSGNQKRLAGTLLMLGEVAIHQQELAAAEIYLQEALFLAIKQGDLLTRASSYQQLGHLNIKARELARQASNTYDNLWQARNAIARGYYFGVDQNLQKVIEENIAIRRYGAAGEAWLTRASLYDKLEDGYQANSARIEAAKLYASTGQMRLSHQLLDQIDQSQGVTTDMTGLKQQINSLFSQFQADQARHAKARDYQMLYQHYLRNGERERAWSFRIKATQSLASTSNRAVFQRQGDVIAVLYNSNFAMQRAKKYLDNAGSIYSKLGASKMLLKTALMEGRNY